MKYRILATFLSVVLLAGCVGEVSYAAPIDSVSVEAEQEPVSVDISENLLQEGGLLAETVNEANDEDEVLVYQSIDEETFKKVEATLLSAYDSFATECDLSAYKILTSEISSVVGDVLNTNPRYFYVYGGFSYYTDGTYVTRLVIKYDYEQAIAEPMLEAFDEAVAVAVEGADESWTEMEKALYINDYLARNCEYDTTYAREFRYTAYGVLVNKVAVCQGYAEAFVVLANELGLNCEVVTSESINHAWNMVEINDKYYQVDATWNDPVNDRIGRARHIYFMKSTAHFQTTDGSYSTHYEEDDWEVTGGWDDSYANDTTYDTYFWNSVDMGFDYVDGEWYGFNGSAIARYDCDGTDFTQEEALKTITDTWYVWGGTSSYWPKKYVGVGAFDKRYYYSTKTAIYQLDLSDYTSDLIYELTDTEKATGYIYGMHIAPTGEVYYILSTSPNEAGTVCHTITLEKNVSKYTICFDGNGATSGDMSSMSNCKYGSGYQLTANTYECAGYTFTGWNTEADGSGTAYEDGAMVSNLSEEDGSTVTLYAQWNKETYSITYQLNGGENSDNNPITYDIDTATITLEDATKEDYVFAGWYSEQGYTKQITEIAKGSTGNITLYAKWNIKKYNIAFDGNEATSGTMSTMSDREYGVSYQLEANTYEREGYTFTGWNTKADGSGTSYADGATVSNLSEEDGSTVTLYAQWSKVTYSITYQLNGGENNADNPVAYDVDTATITLENPTRIGYNFGGWYSDEACNEKVTGITKGSTGNITFFAEWIPYKYNIAFDGNGSTSGFMSDKTDVEYGTEFSLSTNLYECAGYVFAGWNTEADGSGTTYADGASVSNLTTENGGTVTLYAQWEREKFTITYVLDGGENHVDNPADYTVETETIILQDAVKEGHIFEGWYKDEAYTKQVTEIPQGSTESMILHAKWTAIKYHVAFDGNGADEGSMADLTDIEYRESYSLPANTFKRTGYEFIGWNTAPDGNGTSYADEAAILNLTGENGSTVTLFAQWRKLTYTVTYQLNGGQNSVANPGTYDITTQTIALQNPVRTGYTFEGWFTDAAYSVQITAISQGNVGNITLYAKWSANKYNIVFNKNKGTSGSMASLTVSYDENVKLAANKFKRTGYTFKGWNTQANGKGISYADKASVQNLTTENGGTVTLYAQWKKNSINKTKLTLYVGSSETLKLNGTQIKSVKTSSKKVATVTSKGKVTAKKAGKATITLKGKDGKSYKCTVTVKNPTINAKKKTLKVGKTFTLKLTGTTIKSASSSNKKVATVTSKGKVTAKSKGTATITLKGKDKKSYKCTITVK